MFDLAQSATTVRDSIGNLTYQTGENMRCTAKIDVTGAFSAFTGSFTYVTASFQVNGPGHNCDTMVLHITYDYSVRYRLVAGIRTIKFNKRGYYPFLLN